MAALRSDDGSVANAEAKLYGERKMTQEFVKMAIKEGLPFEIHMADGKTYQVPDEYSIALLGNTAVVVVENTLPRILPLLTITGISYLKSPAAPADH